MIEVPGTVIVVDDDLAIREALQSLLGSVGLPTVAYGSAQELLLARLPDGPCCLILDVRLPGRSGLDLQAEWVAAEKAVPIIFITGHGDIPMSVRAMKAGAVEFLVKPFRDQDLLDAIRLALQRDRSRLQDERTVKDIQRRFNALTPREREVMALVAAGHLNKQIAHRLGVSEITIKVHRGQVMRKMEAKSLAGLVRMADRLGLRDPQP